MTSDCHSEFYELGNVSACIVGAVSIVYRNGYGSLSSVKSVLLYEASIDGAAGAAAIEQALGCKSHVACHRVQDERDENVG